MNDIILVQHCQSEHHVNGLTGGWTDTPLTELGRRQAACLAERLAVDLAGHTVQIVSSDLLRAAQTAEIVSERLNVPVALDPQVREFNNGISAGKTQAWADEHSVPFPDNGMGMDRRPFEGAETWREFYARISNAMERLVAQHAANETLVIVSHGGSIGLMICWWLKLSADHVDLIGFGGRAGSIAQFRLGRWQEHQVERLNDRSHLDAAGL